MLNQNSVITDQIKFKFNHLKCESEKCTAVEYLKARRRNFCFIVLLLHKCKDFLKS